MKDRIQKFIDTKGISAGDLASSLDVQRSNISHILNGRNKPGAALIEKMLVVYPDLNARWLLTGEGTMLNTDSEKEIVSKPQKSNSVHPDNVKSTNAEDLSSEEKSIDKIVLLYKDGTFKSYTNK